MPTRERVSRSSWGLIGMRARLERWWHCLGQLLVILVPSGKIDRSVVHCEVDLFDKQDRLFALACTCERVFWVRSDVHEAIREGDPPPC